jgi:hypothetical protein
MPIVRYTIDYRLSFSSGSAERAAAHREIMIEFKNGVRVAVKFEAVAARVGVG